MNDQTKDLLARRARLLGPNVATFYDEPVHIVRGEGVWLWDADGRKYLDCYNNVPHVGHCNKRVVQAIQAQASTLNTHTRYLHEGILDYLDRLVATFGPGLDCGVMTCTGSEANDIALRMAEAATGHRGLIATDATYHGNTALVSQLSRSNVPEVGFGLGQFVRHVTAPDSLRNDDPNGHGFARAVADEIAKLQASETGFAALILCPFFLNEGFPKQKAGWLQPAAEIVRKAGGLLICDEVQSGFGRIGTHFWAHKRHGVSPDIVVLGKPMANGHPVGAVVTGANLMREFRNRFRYFNTFGGNPVSCAAAMAVLDELEDQELMASARHVGHYAQERLTQLRRRYPKIAQVRGSGLIFGAEFTESDADVTPDPALADRVVNEMRRRGVILSRLGRHKNTLKIRPPMVFTKKHAALLFDALDDVLAELI